MIDELEIVRTETILDYERHGWKFYEKIENLVIFRKFGIPIRGREVKFLFILLFGPQLNRFHLRPELNHATEAWEVEEGHLREYSNGN